MKARIKENHWLYRLPVAHRGLHGEGIPENSLPAFSAAIEAGYAVETDLHLLKDGRVVVFHDDTLKRMTGDERNIKELTLPELKALRLANGEEQIPTFEELLSLVAGRVPLLLELKSNGEKGLEEAVCRRLKTYEGAFALQSFDPFALRRVRKIEPTFLRGQLSSFFRDQKFGFWKRTLLKNMRFSPITKVDFISYNGEDLPFPRAKKEGKPLLAWTVKTEKDAARLRGVADNLIFETIRPALPERYEV